MRRPFCLFIERTANMHFLTLIAVQVSDIVEDQKQNQIIEEEKNKLKKAIQEKGRESVIESVFLQRLNHLSTPFSRTVDAAVAEKLEPFSTNTDDPSYLEFVDQTEELKQEYEQGTDCVKLPQGKIVPLGYESYYGRYIIRDGKVFERGAGPARQPRRTKRAKRLKALPNYPFRKLYQDFRQFVEKWAFTDWNEEQQAYGFYSNPNAQWDWYSIGGRWPCQLLVKDTCAEYDRGECACSEETCPQPPKGYQWASAARMKDIQWDAIRKYHRDLLTEQYFTLKECFHSGVLPKEFYGMLVEDGIVQGGQLVFRKDESLEEYLIRMDWYRTRKYPIPACNFLDLDDNWKGESVFGWNPCSQDWETEQDYFLSELSPEDVLVVVDCHI